MSVITRIGSEAIAQKDDFPLHAAAATGDVKTITSLITDGGHCPDGVNRSGATPLILASCEKRPLAMRALLANGADPNHLGLLHVAASCEYTDQMSLLLQYGADINRSLDGWTPLHYAAQESQDGALLYLVERGANLSICDKEGQSVLHRAASNYWGAASTLEIIMGQGLSPNLSDFHGKTALHCAAESCSQPEPFITLIAHGANINQRDERLRTPLYCAASHSRTSVINTLAMRGADLTLANIYGETPLERAVRRNDASVVKALVGAMMQQDQQMFLSIGLLLQPFGFPVLVVYKICCAARSSAQQQVSVLPRVKAWQMLSKVKHTC